MSDKYGIIVAEDGGKITDTTLKLDTRRRTLIVDLERDPKHMQIVRHSGGTNYPDSGTYYDVSKSLMGHEVLYEFTHGLGFVPLVDFFIYAEKYNGSDTDPKTGGYGYGYYGMSGTAGAISDVITYEVDKQNFRIVHNFYVYGAIGYTSDAGSYGFRSKIYIYSIDTGQ